MSDVWIERLTLKLSGLTAEEGRRLAVLVAEALSAADLPASGVSGGGIRLDLRAAPGANMDVLKEQVVSGIVRELSRTA